MNNTVNKLISDRGSCEKLHKKLRFADPVFITSGISISTISMYYNMISDYVIPLLHKARLLGAPDTYTLTDGLMFVTLKNTVAPEPFGRLEIGLKNKRIDRKPRVHEGVCLNMCYVILVTTDQHKTRTTVSRPNSLFSSSPYCTLFALKFCINYCCELPLGGLHIPKSISQQ